MIKNETRHQIDKHKATQHFERAVRYHDARRNDEAVKELKKAVRYNPLKYTYLYNLGTTYLEIDDYRNAYIWYKKCMPFLEEVIRTAGFKGKPKKRLDDNVMMLANLGTVFEQFDDPDAKRCLQAAIKINPHSFNARFNLGLYYCKRDLLEDAIPELSKAYSLDMNSSDTIECLAYAYHNVGMVDESIGLIEGYRKDHPLTNGMLNILGAAYSSFDRTMSGAIKCFQEMVINEPKKSFPHALLAYAYADLGWKNEAYGEIDRAKALNKEEKDKDTEELIKDVLEELDEPEDDNKKRMAFYLLMLIKKKMKEKENLRR